jgi:uncharacterized membrane protein
MTSARLRALSLACLAGLLLLHIGWHSWWVPPEALPVVLVVGLATAPAALALLACAFNLRDGLLIGGIFALGYFCHGVMEAWAVPAVRIPALLEVLLASGQIVLLAVAAVVEKRERRALVAALA